MSTVETNVTTAERTERLVWFRTPNGNRAEMTIREGTNDWNTLNACMTEDEYGLRGLALDGWAIDIGAYLGGVAIGLAIDHPELRVLAVEPVPDNARLVADNVARNGLGDRVRVLDAAAGDGSMVDVWYGYRGTELAEHHAFVGNSSFAYDNGGELPHETATYRSLSLDDLISLTGVYRIALLKIDCEGGEWSILADGAPSLVERIVGEAHAVRGHEGRDIVDLLSATHDVTLQGDPASTCEFRAVAR